MSRLKVDESKVRQVILEREDRSCPICSKKMHVRCHRTRSIHTLSGPIGLKLKEVQCQNKQCDSRQIFSPEQESQLAMPRWGIGWDVFCWIGQRRFSRHWSVPQIRDELQDSYDMPLSDDAIEDHIAKYQVMVAARHQDHQEMANAYHDSNEVVLTIDGLQPEKGHETLYVVREVTRNRVWFAEPLLSGTTDEIRKLFLRAKELADKLGLKVILWVTDKQGAFLKCISQEFPDVPHRYCENHFFRDLAKPILEIDSTSKKRMRSKIRGLRAIEREVLEARQAQHDSQSDTETPSPLAGDDGDVVLDYCSVVRGILNDGHGGPYHPPGLRMVDALADVQDSLGRIASSGNTDKAFSLLDRLKGFIDRGIADQQEDFSRVSKYTEEVRRVMDLLNHPDQTMSEQESLFSAMIDEFSSHRDDEIYQHLSKLMTSFKPGLFAGPDLSSQPRDNLDLERWFRLPKSHERRVHGHRHAGIRIVREGATLIPALDAHVSHPQLLTQEDLAPFENATAPPSQLDSQHRHTVMRKGRSKKNDTNY
jgi:hypothetical protein